MKDWEKRIHAVLGDDDELNFRNACRYGTYLKQHLTLPVRVTGIEDFPWEEPYILGGWDKEEYKKLKETRPSYTDEFDLLDILDPEDEDLIAKIRRVSDRKIFHMELSWLRCVNKKSPEYVTLNDYSIWFVNH